MKNKKNIKPYLISSTAAFVLAVGAGNFLPQKIEAYAHKPSDYKSSYANTHTAYAINIKFPFCHAARTENERVLVLSGSVYTGEGMPYRLSFKEKYKDFALELKRVFIENWNKSVGTISWQDLTKDQNPQTSPLDASLLKVSQEYIEYLLSSPKAYGGKGAAVYFSVKPHEEEKCNEVKPTLDMHIQAH